MCILISHRKPTYLNVQVNGLVFKDCHSYPRLVDREYIEAVSKDRCVIDRECVGRKVENQGVIDPVQCRPNFECS